MSAARPKATSSVWTAMPVKAPSTQASPARRPSARARLRKSVMSGPGVNARISDAREKVRIVVVSGMKGMRLSGRFHRSLRV